MISLKSRFNDENIFKEGIIVGLFFLNSGILMYILHLFVTNTWFVILGGISLSIAIITLFMVVYISYFNEKRSEVFMFLWNEIFYLFLGIPLASICILIIPVSIYLFMFKGGVRETWMTIFIFTAILMISSLIYTGVKVWLNSRSSGLQVPEKIDKGPIEQLLYKMPNIKE